MNSLLPRHPRAVTVFPYIAFQLSSPSLHSNLSCCNHEGTFSTLSPTDAGDDRAPGDPIYVNCCIPLQPPLYNVNQSKELVASEGYQVVIFTNILVNRMARGIQWSTVVGEASSLEKWRGPIHEAYFRSLSKKQPLTEGVYLEKCRSFYIRRDKTTGLYNLVADISIASFVGHWTIQR